MCIIGVTEKHPTLKRLKVTNMKIIIMNINFEKLEEVVLDMPDWVVSLTVEDGVLTGWNDYPQWKNGTFYDDPFFNTEEFYTFKCKYELLEPWKACCNVARSRGVFTVFVS